MINKNDLISIIVKPTNACNLRCKHCYHAGTGYDNEQMSDKILEKLISSSVPHFSGIHYIWHGGEPLSMPLTFYKRALELEQKYKHNPNQNIKNSMQSNGTYVTEDVAKFIADNNILIGFSFEGPYNDFLRSHTNMTLKGYENLKKYNIIPGTIAVVGKHNINNLIDVYEYFRNKNQPLKLNTIFASGSAKENEDILSTFLLDVDVKRSLRSNSSIESSNEFTALENGITKLDEWEKYFEEESGKIEEKYTKRLNNIEISLGEKSNIIVCEEIPSVKKVNTFYFKVTEKQSASGGNQNIKVSPNMGIKII